jgi:hypothetical protein
LPELVPDAISEVKRRQASQISSRLHAPNARLDTALPEDR